MRNCIISTIILFELIQVRVTAQTVDTLININEGLKMHFTIIKGKGVPICLNLVRATMVVFGKV